GTTEPLDGMLVAPTATGKPRPLPTRGKRTKLSSPTNSPKAPCPPTKSPPSPAPWRNGSGATSPPTPGPHASPTQVERVGKFGVATSKKKSLPSSRKGNHEHSIQASTQRMVA